MQSSTNKGFTLIELLVVVAIIGILASAIVMPLYSARDKGKDAKVIAGIKDLKTAIMSHHLDKSEYPPVVSLSSDGIWTENQLSTYLIAENYISQGLNFSGDTPFFYVHSCSPTTPCDAGGAATNANFMSPCGVPTGTNAALIFGLKNGPSAGYQTWPAFPTLNVICFD